MSARGFTVLIVGGYGTFGARLTQLLGDTESLTLLIAGRSPKKAAAFCAGFRGRAHVVPLPFDRDGDVESELRRTNANLVVDASGPFQSYAEDRYRLVNAALSAGIDYIDLADSSEFVKGVDRFDAEAKTRGIFVLSGVSTFPVLTVAVMEEFAKDMAHIEAVIVGLVAVALRGCWLEPRACGRRLRGKAGGVDPERSEDHRLRADGNAAPYAPPGALPLGNVLFSLVDVSDLRVIPELWPSIRSVWIGVGPLPQFLHRALIGLAWTVRLGVLRTLSPFAGIMYRTVNWLARNKHRSGMFISVEGTSVAGENLERAWHLIAEGEDGPMIPSMAAAVIIRRCLDGRRPDAGARAGAGEIDLDAYRELFEGRAIRAGLRERSSAMKSWPLYRRLLGDAWKHLPAPLRDMHALENHLTAHGVATVECGTGLFGRFIAGLLSFPREGRDIPITVHFTAENGRETWVRSFAGSRFATVQMEGGGRSERLLCERFGPVGFSIALVLEDGRLKFVVRGWDFLGLPLPLALAPLGSAYEYVSDGRFGFDVDIRHRWLGSIVRYRGWLLPERVAARPHAVPCAAADAAAP
jgi:uncharacterized protein DUF4166